MLNAAGRNEEATGLIHCIPEGLFGMFDSFCFACLSNVFFAGFSITCPVRFLEIDIGSPRPINRGQFGVDGYEDGLMAMRIRIEVTSSRPDQLPTLSASKTSNLYLLVKSHFCIGAADASNATPAFCFNVPAISKLTTLTVESLWTAPTETAIHHILAIDEAS